MFYFGRDDSVREMINFFSKTFIKRTGLGVRQSIQHEGMDASFAIPAFGLLCSITNKHSSCRVLSCM